MILIKNQEKIIKFPKLKEETLSDSIVIMLMQEWPLTTNGIIQRLRQNSKQNYSKQATYKAIKKLRENQIISKNGKYYLLNKNWLLEIKILSNKIIKDYNKNEINLTSLP